MLRRIFLIAALCSTLNACSMSADTSSAEQAVTKFHDLLDSGNFAQIYDESSDELKRTAPRKDFLELLSAVHRKLGATKTTDKQTWNVNYQTSGTFISLGYRTVYTEGEATEQFVFRIKDSVALLAGYHVSSMALITK